MLLANEHQNVYRRGVHTSAGMLLRVLLLYFLLYSLFGSEDFGLQVKAAMLLILLHEVGIPLQSTQPRSHGGKLGANSCTLSCTSWEVQGQCEL